MNSLDRRFFRVHLGRQAFCAQECFENNFVGVDFGMDINLENDLLDDPRKFNKKFIPIMLEKAPERTRISAGLARE